jgi:hypothetical protein
MPYWLGLCVLRMTCRQNGLYETLFHTVIILSKHHHHHYIYSIPNDYNWKINTINDKTTTLTNRRYAEFIGSTLKTVTELAGGDISKATLMYTESGVDLASKISKGPKQVNIYMNLHINIDITPHICTCIYVLYVCICIYIHSMHRSGF